MRCTVPVICLLLFLNPASSGSQNVTIKDDMGNVHVLGAPPRRIISLAPNVTEILFALGLENQIAGVTRYCNYPANAQTKTQIGGLVDPDLEKIIDLSPDLIIAFRGNPLRLVRRLKDLNLPIFVLESGTTLESVFVLVEKIGLVTRRERAAEALVNLMRGNLKRVKDALKDVQTRPNVFINLHGKGLWTCGKGSFLNDMVQQAKGANIAGDIDRAWFNYNREELIHQNPEYIIVITRMEEDFLEIKTWFAEEAHLESIRAVRENNIYYLDEDLVTRPGPRIFEAIDHLARILHPSSFEDGR